MSHPSDDPDPMGHDRPSPPHLSDAEEQGAALHQLHTRPTDYDHDILHGKAQHILEKVKGTDEPIFILRARDLLSVPTILKYLELYGEFMPRTVDFEASVVNAVEGFRQWQQDNPDKVRWPD